MVGVKPVRGVRALAGCDSGVEVIEATEVGGAPIYADAGEPTPALGVPANPIHPTGVGSAASLVAGVGLVTSITEVADQVVPPVVVFVVYLGGPIPIVHSPDDPVGQQLAPIQLPHPIAVAIVGGEGLSARVPGVPCRGVGGAVPPVEPPSGRLVPDALVEAGDAGPHLVTREGHCGKRRPWTEVFQICCVFHFWTEPSLRLTVRMLCAQTWLPTMVAPVTSGPVLDTILQM